MIVQFKQHLKDLKKQSVKPKEDGRYNEFAKIKDKDASRAGNERDGLQADREADGTEGVDEDMIVTQSQTNFICPITQLEMKKPVKNKVCGHTYEAEAIVRMIESKHKRKKKACCPKIGCSHTDIKRSDLMQDEALRRAIESHNKKNTVNLSREKPPACREVSSLPYLLSQLPVRAVLVQVVRTGCVAYFGVNFMVLKVIENIFLSYTTKMQANYFVYF